MAILCILVLLYAFLQDVMAFPAPLTITSYSSCGPNEPCSASLVTRTLNTAITTGSPIVTSITSIESCPDSETCAALVSYVTTIVPTINPSVPVAICIYTITGDMYGLGVRIGFYLQAASNFIAAALLPRGIKEGRTTSAILVFGLVTAFELGIGESSLALESPVIVALMSMLTLPLLMQPALDWSWKEQAAKQSSLLVISALYIAATGSSIWGVIHGWNRGSTECDILSGISGRSALSQRAQTLWLVLFSLALAFSVFWTLAGICKTWAANGKPSKSKPKQLWYTRSPICFLSWAGFWILLMIVCLLSIERTIAVHGITPPGLSKTEYGQWIAFSVGLGAVVDILWKTILTWYDRLSTTKSQNPKTGPVGGHGSKQAERPVKHKGSASNQGAPQDSNVGSPPTHQVQAILPDGATAVSQPLTTNEFPNEATDGNAENSPNANISSNSRSPREVSESLSDTSKPLNQSETKTTYNIETINVSPHQNASVDTEPVAVHGST